MGKEKSLGERLKEMVQLYQQLQRLGIEHQFEEMEEFYQSANRFIKEKKPASGIISLPSLQRELHYELFLYHPKPSEIYLKFVG